jgi:protein-disulfide isomerase
VIYRAAETATRDPTVFQTQQLAALAAGKQQRLWDYVELFYHEQGAEGSGYVTEAYLQGLAQQIPGLDVVRWRSDRNDSGLSAQLTADARQAVAQGVQGTPTLIAQGRRGTAQAAGVVPTYSQLEQAIKSVA